jgi:hypothetical protein
VFFIREPLTLTGLLALWGAVLSSITFGWNLLRDLRDRAHLKLGAHLRRIAPGPLPTQIYAVTPDLPVADRTEALFVFMDVTNVGRRPVRWDGWGGEYRQAVDGKFTFTALGRALPKMLAEGDSHSEFVDNLHQGIENVKRLFVWDASGKEWRLRRRELKKLKTEVREHYKP